MNQLDFQKTDKNRELRETIQADIISIGKMASKQNIAVLESICIEFLAVVEYASLETLNDVKRFIDTKKALYLKGE